jgi:membrane protease YdiL (CAAX protease family)
MSDNPILVTAMIAAAAFLFHLWWSDLRAARAGHPRANAFPGAVSCERQTILVAIAGILILLGLETGGEAALSIADQQKTVTVLWSLYSLAAAFIEELAFRGYLVVASRGRAALWGSIVVFSAVFALCHPFLWEWTDGHLVLQLTTKGWFSTAAIFAGSLWFYTLRFSPLNPSRSLLPCIVAHLVKNLGVFALKATAGFVSGWY